MKKIYLLAAAAVFAFASVAQAGFNGPSNIDRVTVAEALKLKDETHVVLQGYIESHLGDEDYMFKDNTGSIRVEIDQDLWHGLDVTPKDKVEIQGEVDTHFYKPTEIEVDRIRLVK